MQTHPHVRTDRVAVASVTGVLTAAMGFSMLQLFVLGALGPRIVPDLGMSSAMLGFTTTVGFGTAALLSPIAGRAVDLLGPRRCLGALLGIVACALALIASAPGYVVLLLAVGLGGAPQALANPATNKAILAAIPAPRRAGVTGTKQSGVQLGAIAAGLPLTALAAVAGWRPAVWVAAGIAVLTAVWVWRILPADAPRNQQGANAFGADSGHGAAGVVRWLVVFSVFLGAGMASINTYLALFGERRLGLGAAAAGMLVAVLGVAGIAGRIGWARLAAKPGVAVVLPAGLAAGSAVAAVLLAAAPQVNGLVWVAVIGVGVFGMAGNAVSMVLVIQRAAPGRAGRDSALVSAGFFAGFAVGPPLFGLLLPVIGYRDGWLTVAAEFATAAGVAAAWALRDRGQRSRALQDRALQDRTTQDPARQERAQA
ncbi:MFS transporter [Nocardia sp. NBC_01009]|uniref:MFS transporter n=1 Tax=Nocardia sp. NBC_01009 TaxID=2975996 RepID=UPI00386F8AF9|nr:MFS transporter [Nocardia sp. NBC_01009]